MEGINLFLAYVLRHGLKKLEKIMGEKDYLLRKLSFCITVISLMDRDYFQEY